MTARRQLAAREGLRPPSALLVDRALSLARLRKRLRPAAEAAGMTLGCCEPENVTREIRTLLAMERNLAVVVLGLQLPDRLSVARRLRRDAPAVEIVFVADGDRGSLGDEVESPFALIGSHWRLLDLREDDPSRVLAGALAAVRQRLRFRTTIDRVNVQLASHSPPDVSEHRRFAASDRFLGALLQSAQDAIVTTGPGSEIVLWNPAAERLFGISQDDALGRPLASIAKGHWPAGISRLIRRLRSELAESSPYEMSCARADGTPLSLEVVISEAIAEGGELLGFSAIVRDTGERRRAEDELARSRERLMYAQKMESIGVLAGGVAHDFNNILMAILGNVELGLRSVEPGHKIHKHLRHVRDSATRASELTSQLLSFGRRQFLAKRRLQPNELILDALEVARSVLGEKIEVRRELSAGVNAIFADATRIRQVISNLLANARDAMPDGGELRIRTRTATRLRAPAGEASGRERDYVEISIEDTGTGIDEAVLPRIFEPFYTTKDVDRGTGLGLSVALGIVEQHEGFIEVESRPGVGTTLRVLIPAGETAGARRRERTGARTWEREDGDRAAPRTILVVEDDVRIRELVEAMLESLGYRVLLAPDSEGAEEIFERHVDEIDLLLTDVVMPKLSGPEVCARLRERKPGLPVIFVSGYDFDNRLESLSASKTAGQRTLQKPFGLSDLSQAARALLHRS